MKKSNIVIVSALTLVSGIIGLALLANRKLDQQMSDEHWLDTMWDFSDEYYFRITTTQA